MKIQLLKNRFLSTVLQKVFIKKHLKTSFSILYMYVFFPFNLLVFHEDFQSEAELFELLTFHLKSGHCSSSEKQEPIQK